MNTKILESQINWLLRWSVISLISITWFSALFFGIYIIIYFGGAVLQGVPEQWNLSLPRLYEPQTFLTNLGIGIHFLAGGILLFLGPIQLLTSLRLKYPLAHRVTGRIYILSSFLVGIGGLAYVLFKGTIGGLPMNIGFGLYGLLMVLCAFKTLSHAIARRLDEHRAWAIRLFALAIGSWLYRMDYGFWELIANGAGHTKKFDGPFDIIMVFFFYIPNLIIAEFYIRPRRFLNSLLGKGFALVLISVATLLSGMGTYYFVKYTWAPAIFDRITGG